MASPTCTVQDGAGAPASTVNGVTVTAGDTITIALVSVAGVFSWTIACIGTDELQVAATINAGLTVNGVAKTATFTMPAAAALGFRSTVVDVNGVSTSTQFGIYSLANGLRVGFVGETTEGSAAFGTAATINAKIRQAAGGGATLPKTRTRRATAIASTITTADDLVEVTAASATQTLPASPSDGHEYEVCNNCSSSNVVNGGGHNINATAAATMTLAPFQSVTFSYSSASTAWLAS